MVVRLHMPNPQKRKGAFHLNTVAGSFLRIGTHIELMEGFDKLKRGM
jgi:hypothetical protein